MGRTDVGIAVQADACGELPQRQRPNGVARSEVEKVRRVGIIRIVEVGQVVGTVGFAGISTGPATARGTARRGSRGGPISS
ncbi:hypothetical protein GCM10027570_55040 [Streptomonospora sediminis]